MKKFILDAKEFEEKEKNQCHFFIFFYEGPPYCELGWRNYRRLNELLSLELFELKNSHKIEIYTYEHEVVEIDSLFIWGFGFIERDPSKKEMLELALEERINSVLKNFYDQSEKQLLRSSDAGFNDVLGLVEYYCALVAEAECELEPVLSMPKIKSYEKKDFNLNDLKKPIAAADFNALVRDYVSFDSPQDLIYMAAQDGFFANKYRPNKYLREELLPLFDFISARQISDGQMISLGLEKEEFDAKITGKGDELIIEITSGAPVNDYQLFSILGQSPHGTLPLKTMAQIKIDRDCLACRIVNAIEAKHAKNYGDGRLLIVVAPIEYAYHGNDEFLSELIDEIRSSIVIGDFKEIVLMMGRRLYSLI